MADILVLCPACGEKGLQLPSESQKVHGAMMRCSKCEILVEFVPRIITLKREPPITQEDSK